MLYYNVSRVECTDIGRGYSCDIYRKSVESLISNDFTTVDFHGAVTVHLTHGVKVFGSKSKISANFRNGTCTVTETNLSCK